MPNIFEVIDPRGQRVICTEDRWNNHILTNHPFMVGREDEVKQAVQSPMFGIYRDTDFNDRNIYYRLRSHKRQYIKVVVDFEQGQPGRVVTAFPTDSPKAGEYLIWPESNV